jgi:hypothetical protein
MCRGGRKNSKLRLENKDEKEENVVIVASN